MQVHISWNSLSLSLPHDFISYRYLSVEFLSPSFSLILSLSLYLSLSPWGIFVVHRTRSRIFGTNNLSLSINLYLCLVQHVAEVWVGVEAAILLLAAIQWWGAEIGQYLHDIIQSNMRIYIHLMLALLRLEILYNLSLSICLWMYVTKSGCLS